jgi:hypothetical protein
MSSVIIPPTVRPRPKGFGRKPNNFYTIHSAENNIFSLNIDNHDKTVVVGFKILNDAVLVSRMIEAHYIQHKEWPDTRASGLFSLPPPTKASELSHVFLHKWDLEDLKVTCTRNILDMVSVEEIIHNNNDKYSFSGSLYKFEAPVIFYQERFEEFLQ